MPDLAAGARINRPDMIRNRDVEHAVDNNRRPLDRECRDHRRHPPGPCAGIRAMNPGQRHRIHVACIDSRQRAEAAAGVVAVVHRPGIRQRAAATWQDPGFPAHRRQSVNSITRETFRGLSFQCLQIGEDVVHVRIGVLIEQLVMRRQRIANLHFHVGGRGGSVDIRPKHREAKR